MQSPFQFLVVTLFDLYIMVILLRFLLQLFRADFYNPLSQFIVKATDPVLKQLRKVIPGIGGIDVSSLLFAYIVSFLKYCILYLLFVGMLPGIGRVFILSLADLLNQSVELLFWMILIRSLMSWINPSMNNPVMAVIYQLTEPLMAPVRRVIPSMGGLDLSPIVLLLGLRFSTIAINDWILSPLLRAM